MTMMNNDLFFKLAKKDVDIAALLAICAMSGRINITSGKEVLEIYCILKSWLEKTDIADNHPIRVCVCELEDLNEDRISTLNQYYANWKNTAQNTSSDDIADIVEEINPADIDEAFVYTCILSREQNKVC